MERVEPHPALAPSRLERLTLVAGVLLLATLTLLPWHSGGPQPTPGGASGRTAIQAPGAVYGIAAAVLIAAAVAWLASATLVTRPPVDHPRRALVPLAAAVLVLVLVKLLVNADELAVGAWASLLLATVVAGAAVSLAR